MRHCLIVLLLWLGAALVGCSKSETTEPEYVPDIPPGRGSSDAGTGNPIDEQIQNPNSRSTRGNR